jgi:ankyrin repeat protein
MTFFLMDLGDLNGLFLLLHWAANPNTLDDNGNTPLLWLVKNISTSGHVEMARLLVKYGADVMIRDNNGDTVMHILAKNPEADLSLSFAVYQAGKTTIPTVANNAGLVAYSVRSRVFVHL